MKAFAVGLFLQLVGHNVVAQNSVPHSAQSLNDRLAELDSSLFSTVYTCNPDKNITFFTEDKGGSTKSRKAFMETLEKNFCGEQDQR